MNGINRRTGPRVQVLTECAVFFLLLWSPTHIVQATPNYSLDHITTEDGLPQSSVRAIAQDKAGFLWVGTEAGLSRYDGYRFLLFSPPFGHGIVNDIHVDSRGRIWTAWYDKPVTVYDPVRDEWQATEVRPPRNFRPGFMEDPLGVIWLSDGRHLSYFDESAGNSVVVAELPFDVLIEHRQSIVWHDGVIWVNALGELVGYDIDQGIVIARLKYESRGDRGLWVHQNAVWLCNRTEILRMVDHSNLLPVYRTSEDTILSCSHGPDNSLWVGTENTGAIHIDISGTQERFAHSADDSMSLADNRIFSIQQDSRDQLWLITQGTANLYLDGQFLKFKHSPGSAPGLSWKNAEQEFLEDKSGVIWLGSARSGLARISPFSNKFRRLVPPSEVDTHVRKPVMDALGNLWIGMHQDGVYKWNRRVGSWIHFGDNKNDETSLPTREVRAMLATFSGDIWAGAFAPIINHYDRTENSWHRYSLGPLGTVYNLLELPNGKIIVGRELILTSFNPATGDMQHYPLEGIPHIRATTLSRSGNVYVGTHQGPGVLEFVPGQGFTRTWSEELSETNIFSLYEDRLGFLWVGTWGGGLNRLDPDKRQVQVLSTDNGLPDNTIFGILPDGDDLWVSTYAGLAKVENCVSTKWPCTPQIKTFDASDGLQISEFDAEAHLLAPTGEMFFGGADGFIYFHPNDIESNSKPPELQFTDVRLNERSLLPHSIYDENGLVLDNDFGLLELSFSALDFHRPENNEFKYRLQPSSNWIPLGPNPTLNLNNLGAGRYSLEIMGSNNDGVWSSKALTLKFTVLPPPYLRWQAVASYVLILFLAIAAFVRVRERILRERRAELQLMVDERTKELRNATAARDEFYANISHEFRTPLTLLLNSVEHLEKAGDAIDNAGALSKIERQAKNLQRYVDSMITVSHLNSTPDIDWLAEDVSIYLRNLVSDLKALPGSTSINLDRPTTEPVVVRSYPNALDTIFPNLLVNALKYVQEDGQVDIHIEEEQKTVVVTISDSGPGIDEGTLDTVFDRGVRGKAGDRRFVGYGIGLSLVKQTVDALDGSIRVYNNPGSGACFEVQLPKANSSLPISSYGRKLDTTLFSEAQHDSSNPVSDREANSLTSVVLIIEDHDELRKDICELLCREYSILEASTADSAINMAIDNVPDVVICDVMLPDKDGFEVLQAIKTSSVTDHIPVLMLTALADEESKMRGLVHRADAYITKPFRHDVLRLTVGNLLLERRAMMRFSAMKAWRENAVRPGSTEDRVPSFERHFMSALESTYDDPDCSVDSLAGMVAVSRRQLERKTRFYFGQSPNTLLLEYRLQKAADLLRSGCRIIDVSNRIGFGTQSHFGTVFKQHYGCTPSDYARKYLPNSGRGDATIDAK